MRDTATEIDIEPASSMPKVTLEYGSRHMQRTPSAHLKQTRRRAYVEEVNQYEDNAEDSDLHNLDKATRSSDSHRPSEKAGWALPEYRPAEYHSRSSSIDSRGRSTSGWWETAK